ncbi:hypothetical protein Tco_0928362 [Tanacetum coccineum]
MSTHEQHTPTIPTSAVRNTGGRSGPQNLEEPASDEVLRELCDKNYHQLLPLISEKMKKEKEQQDKLKAVKARLLYGDESGKNPRDREELHYSESKTPTTRTEPRRRHGNRHSRSPSPIVSVFRRLKRNRPLSPRPRPRKEGVCSIGWEEKNIVHLHALTATTKVTMSRNLRYNQGSVIITAHRPEEPADIRRVKTAREGHWKSKSKRHRSDTYEDDLSQSWTCEERNPFTPWIRHFDFPRTRMPSHVKTYDGSGDPEDHLKRF